MAHITVDRVLEVTTTEGTADLILGGAVASYRAFSSVMANADTCHYTVAEVDPAGRPTGAWETGRGTYQSGVLQRTTVVASTNAGAKVPFSAGPKRVSIAILAPSTPQLKADWRVGLEAPSVVVVAASTVDLAAQISDVITVTGNTTITSLGTLPAGAIRKLRFTGTPQLVHNATSLILPGAATISVSAGDTAEVESLGSGNWRVRSYMRASGKSVVLPSKVDVGLPNVDNTTDASKPVSTAQEARMAQHQQAAVDRAAVDADSRASTAYTNAVNQAYANESNRWAGSPTVGGNLFVSNTLTVGGNVHANAHYVGNTLLNQFGITVRHEGNNGGLLFMNAIDANPGGMQMALSFQHLPGQFAHSQFQVGAASFSFGSDNNASKGGGSTAWTVPSDVRVKQDIEDYTGGLDQILSLRPRKFRYTDDPSQEYVGVVAQEAEVGMPEIIGKRLGKIGDEVVPDLRFLKLDPLHWALVNSVHKLHARIAELEARDAL